MTRQIQRYNTSPRAAKLGLCLAASGCGDLDLPPISHRTDEVAVGLDFDGVLCTGDLDFLDERVRYLESTFGASRDEVEIYLYDEVPDACNGAFGCYFADDDVILTTWSAVDHEIVHAVIHPFTVASDFWEEGAAEAFRPRFTRRGATTVKSNVSKSHRSVDLWTVGHFVRWLTEDHGGAQRIRRILVGDDFQEVYGRTFDDVVGDYEENSPWSYPSQEWCDAPALAGASDDWSEAVSVRCSDPGVSAFVGFSVLRAFEVEAAGEYELHVSGGDGVRLHACEEEVLVDQPADEWRGDVPSDQSDIVHGKFFSANEIHTLQLEPAKHRMRVSSDGTDNVTITVELRRVGP